MSKISFDYVLQESARPSVGFLSGAERGVIQVEDLPGPGQYIINYGNIGSEIRRTSTSTRGSSSFANHVPRHPVSKKTSNIPDFYMEKEKPIKVAKVPFNNSMARFPTTSRAKSLLTGPRFYNISTPVRGYTFNMAFNSQRKTYSAIRTICSPINNALCMKCFETPNGDYYRNFETRHDMCNACMRLEISKLGKCNVNQDERTRSKKTLLKFVPVRHCAYLHQHFGSYLSRVLPKDVERFKINKENYLFSHEKVDFPPHFNYSKKKYGVSDQNEMAMS